MPSNLAIDDKLLAEAQRVGHHKTKKETVSAALSEYVARRKQLRILELFGTIDYDPDYNYVVYKNNQQILDFIRKAWETGIWP